MAHHDIRCSRRRFVHPKVQEDFQKTITLEGADPAIIVLCYQQCGLIEGQCRALANKLRLVRLNIQIAGNGSVVKIWSRATTFVDETDDQLVVRNALLTIEISTSQFVNGFCSRMKGSMSASISYLQWIEDDGQRITLAENGDIVVEPIYEAAGAP